MYKFYMFLVLLGVCNVFLSEGFEYETYYFKQKVDHFSYCHGDYFPQRYLMASQYWDENGGPIFFYTGNEGDITMFANNTGFMWEQAPTFKALLIFAEHRYYGLSLPYGNKSLQTPEKRGYLTTEQALADFADLIYYLKHKVPSAKKSPVIAFGGSYGGMLAAWMRIKYPHLVNGAIASSAPIFQLSYLTPCEKFAEIVTRDFAYSGPNCSELIRKSWKAIRSIGKTTLGAKWLSSNFNLCDPLSTTDIDQLVNWLQDTWSFLAMLDYPYATNFLLPLPANPVKEACKYLNDSSQADKELMKNIFKAASVFQNFTGDVVCFNLSISGGTSLGGKAWDYQSCTEMVMPMCQNGESDMFEPVAWDFNMFSKQCMKDWQIRPDPNKAVMMYGGKNISAASNIVFSNGKLDPWSAGGVIESLSDTLVAYFMSKAAHHLDLRSSNAADPHSVVKTRAAEVYWINKWVLEAKV